MKKILTCIAVLFVAYSFPPASHAQFLKNLMSNVNQSIQNRAAGKVVGKPDSTSQAKGAASHGTDSASLAKMMASFSQAGPAKPSVSPADSAAAIKTFMSGSGGSGLYYAYQVTEHITARGKDSTLMDTSATYIAENGNSRSDFGLFGTKMATLGHLSQIKYSLSLNAENKTYWLNIIDTAAINQSKESYTVTKVGSETVAGYHCIHSKLTLNSNSKTPIVEDIWTSTDVPGYAGMKKMMAIRNITPKMISALDQAGCGGFFVKMTMQSQYFSMTMIMIAADHRTFPGSIFQIPSGYSQGSNNAMLGAIMQGAMKKQ